MSLEFSRLNLIANQFGYSDGLMQKSIEYSFDIFMRYLVKGPILELGPAEGVMTTLLHNTELPLTVVEGSEKYCKSISNTLPDVKVCNSLFEDYEPSNKFANIILGHVLEHVEDPLSLLKKAKEWLLPGGIIFAAVPNADSLHRQSAVLMGLLPSENSLNKSDIEHGHRRVFKMMELLELFSLSGCQIVHSGGYWLKPLSNHQIQRDWTHSMVDAYMRLGEKYPEISAEIYLIAS